MMAPLSAPVGSVDRKLCLELDLRILDGRLGRTFLLTLLKMDKLLPKPDFPTPETELRLPLKAVLSLFSIELLARLIRLDRPVSSREIPDPMLLFLKHLSSLIC